MLRQTLGRRFAAGWTSLGEFASTEADAAAFRAARAADASVQETIDTSQNKPQPIDWSKWSGQIQHKDLVENLKAYHDQTVSMLDGLIKEDHNHAIDGLQFRSEHNAMYDAAVKSCEESVQASETIVANGAKALYISYNNPPVSTVSTSEWLDVDQYWQAFVEKHHHYHNHLNSAVEDPESREYEDKQRAALLTEWAAQDDTRNNKLLYQRPSYEYYHIFRGVLVQHMVYYLAKSGGDARFFPELMPHSWFCGMYDLQFKLYDNLQAKKRATQEAGLLMGTDHEYHPHDMEGDGEAYYGRLIAHETEQTQNLVGRLMGNFIFLSEAVPVQTVQGLGNAKGKQLYSLGDDVNALFVKEEGDVSPTDAFQSLSASLPAGGMPDAYKLVFEEFCNILEARQTGLGGSWFNAPGESQADAFLRRLKFNDRGREVYEEYVAELKGRWANATPVSAEEAAKRMPEIEKKYKLECETYEKIVYDGLEV